MANRAFTEFVQTLEKKVVNLYAQVSIGATGAPTLITTSTQANGSSAGNPSKGFINIVRLGVGQYQIFLGTPSTASGPNSVDTYNRLLYMNVVALGGVTVGIPSIQIISDDSDLLPNPSISFFTLGASGLAVDPASGTVLFLEAFLSNSNL